MHRIFDDAQRVAFQGRIRAILFPAVSRLGWSPQPGESELESQLRSELLGAVGTLGEDQTVQEKARQLYAQFGRHPTAVDRNLIPALVSIVSHTGDKLEYENFLSNFKNARTPQEETRYLFALANFRQPELIGQTLKLVLSAEVRTQNAPTSCAPCSSTLPRENPLGRS